MESRTKAAPRVGAAEYSYVSERSSKEARMSASEQTPHAANHPRAASRGMREPRLAVAQGPGGRTVDIEALWEMKQRGEARPDCTCLSCARALTAKLGT